MRKFLLFVNYASLILAFWWVHVDYMSLSFSPITPISLNITDRHDLS
jgi:hypothetical protein